MATLDHRLELSNPKVIAVALVVATALAVGSVAEFAYSSSTSRATSSSSPSGGIYNGQTYSGGLMGGELYENNSFPFASYAETSQILALPAISAWLTAHGYTPLDLRPYLSLYPSGGNPYDFAQGSATENGTTYLVYEYLVTNSTNGVVIGAWVTPNMQTVAKIFTYDSTGPDAVAA